MTDRRYWDRTEPTIPEWLNSVWRNMWIGIFNYSEKRSIYEPIQDEM